MGKDKTRLPVVLDGEYYTEKRGKYYRTKHHPMGRSSVAQYSRDRKGRVTPTDYNDELPVQPISQNFNYNAHQSEPMTMKHFSSVQQWLEASCIYPQIPRQLIKFKML